MSMLYSYYGLSSLADTLLSGESNFLEKMITERLEEVGRVWLKEKVDELVGHDLARRMKRGYTTGGLSEIRRLKNSALGGGAFSARSGFIGRTSRAITSGFETEVNRRETEIVGSDFRRGVVDRMENALLGEKPDTERRNQQTWSGSRQQWLDAGWRHDWRSQPRDPKGRWTQGRLKHPYMTQGARRIRRQRIAAARKAVKELWREEQ